MTLQIRPLVPADIAVVFVSLQLNGWAHRMTDQTCLEQLISASQHNLVAVQAGEVVGYVRAISDGLSNGYVSMLVVCPAYRRQGIGAALMDTLIETAPQATWVLRAGREGASEFFAKTGFVMSSIAMERPRPG